MITRLFAGAVVLSVGLAPAAFAASPPVPAPAPHKIVVAKRCVTLEEQFSAALPTHPKALLVKTAREREAEGIKLCGEGKPLSGEWRLRLALRDLGVLPKA